MKPPAFAYHSPASLPEAIELLAQNENSRVLAGGQSLMPMLNFRLAAPEHLIDLGNIGELAYIREAGGEIAFGAMTRQRDVEYSELVAGRLPLLAEAIRSVGHRQTRNRGTVGGSLCHLDPSAEIPTIAMAMDASLRIASRRGTRELAMAAFPAGLMSPAMDADELLVEIRLRPWAPGHGWSFIEYSRRHGDFALASVAVLLLPGKAGRIERASITLGGVAYAPVRVAAAEQALVNSDGGAGAIARAAEACGQVDALDDPHAPSWYRKRLARTLCERALKMALSRAQAAAR